MTQAALNFDADPIAAMWPPRSKPIPGLSAKLSRALAAFRIGGTTLEIQRMTDSCSVHADAWHLRKRGFNVVCEAVGTSERGARVSRWRLETNQNEGNP